ncbi:hypothetical protein D6D20_07986 [Aureobasidium pullulans]|uniref:Ubiquitin-like domain-containing protein n=1 Tax=Aureobasidium pullulans TaxID=5580 RepID=A0A4S8YRH2_AURPU|nr:hypothetical protein D6D20_07986 [Aureobasidium pullulans]TIA03482.1 hypothetical protein D6C82_01839 [Aureobasidium pullulans]
MADPFTIAVSVGGLASLGIQLLQGLNKYAGSALDSKGRIKAISTDIGLTVQVVQALDTTIQDDANREMMNDDAEKLAKEAVVQCQEIFTKIQSTLPDIDPAGIRKRDFVTWPFIEPKLELLRGNLEKVKATLQLLMNVIIFAAMSKRHAGKVSLDQQRIQIQKLVQEKTNAEARLEKLEREHADALAANILTPPSPLLSSASKQMPAVPQDPGPIINLAMVAPPPALDTPTRDLIPTTPEGTENAARTHRHSSTQQSPSPSAVHLQEIHASLGASRSTPSSDNDSDSESEDIMITLHDDYTACLRKLKTLQMKLDMALKKMFIPTTGMPTVNPEHDAIARGKVVKVIENSVRETYACLEQRILGPSAHRTIKMGDEHYGDIVSTYQGPKLNPSPGPPRLARPARFPLRNLPTQLDAQRVTTSGTTQTYSLVAKMPVPKPLHHDAEERSSSYHLEREMTAAAEVTTTSELLINQLGPHADNTPIRFTDALDRKFILPWSLVRSWKGMKTSVRRAFVNIEHIGPHVANGCYNLLSPDNEIILPSAWEMVIQPGWDIKMELWPLPDSITEKINTASDVSPPEIMPTIVGAPENRSQDKSSEALVSAFANRDSSDDPIVEVFMDDSHGRWGRARSKRKQSSSPFAEWMLGGIRPCARPRKHKHLSRSRGVRKTNERSEMADGVADDVLGSDDSQSQSSGWLTEYDEGSSGHEPLENISVKRFSGRTSPTDMTPQFNSSPPILPQRRSSDSGLYLEHGSFAVLDDPGFAPLLADEEAVDKESSVSEVSEDGRGGDRNPSIDLEECKEHLDMLTFLNQHELAQARREQAEIEARQVTDSSNAEKAGVETGDSLEIIDTDEDPRSRAYSLPPHSDTPEITASSGPSVYASSTPDFRPTLCPKLTAYSSRKLLPWARYRRYGRAFKLDASSQTPRLPAITHDPPLPMPGQCYTRPALSFDSSYGRERQSASPDVDQNAPRRKIDAMFAERSGRDELIPQPPLSPPRTIIDPELDNDTATNTSGLVTVDDLLRRWTHLDPDSVDSAADLGS